MSVRHWLFLSLCAVLLAGPLVAWAARSPMPYGSFSTKPVSSVQDLANLIRQDKVAAVRYSRHFGMAPSALADYLEKNVTLKRLSKTGRYMVYFVGKNGQIVPHHKTLKAGRLVFVTWTGAPIIDLECGNPLTTRLPKRVIATKPEIRQITQEPVTQVAEAPPTELPPTVEAKVLDLPPTVITAETVIAPIPTAPLSVAPKLGSWLVPALLGAGAIGTLGGGGGDNLVPEPAGVMVLGVATFGFICRYCGKRWRRTRERG